MSTTILIADDNIEIIDILTPYLKREGYDVVSALNGEEALNEFKTSNPSLILLDVMMPIIDGMEVCRIIRRESDVPIIMLTARGEYNDKILGLELGADDYIVKPFSPGEVIARIKAIFRRIDNAESSSKPLTLHNLEINIETYTVKINHISITLTKKEIELLYLLASNPGRVFTRDVLLDKIWGYEYFGNSRTVDTHIKRLRSKLNIKDDFLWDIKTLWGLGYKFEVKEHA
ncbi:DNA-binding response regulator, OmpR family, contains REC and winged-helix (wHTH) domain [Clostridium amylolyticum]|uniref:Stage 0 sporulation protein A homolog n=1 Tax=Clostridium amylolyticum TaxID=1121298 RepID=A0A1M6IIH9_9CLOT|nr:response regulator transcription factor [Clostridium amylolyticum]SHJ34281.1 DNA-binding response regulator, OmpR family, contains REC and winged-helix (wHTH) domain [Clostridium amylolyticum]